jgi:hypothetical protein
MSEPPAAISMVPPDRSWGRPGQPPSLLPAGWGCAPARIGAPKPQALGKPPRIRVTCGSGTTHRDGTAPEVRAANYPVASERCVSRLPHRTRGGASVPGGAGPPAEARLGRPVDLSSPARNRPGDRGDHPPGRLNDPRARPPRTCPVSRSPWFSCSHTEQCLAPTPLPEQAVIGGA